MLHKKICVLWIVSTLVILGIVGFIARTNMDIDRTRNALQLVRLRTLNEYCQQMNLSRDEKDIEKYVSNRRHFLNSPENTMLIDENHKVILRAIPKTGCSTWRLTFLNNSVAGPLEITEMTEEDIHVPKFMEKYRFHAFKAYNHSQGISRLRNYPAILTVRHPLDRLESAFVDKFTKPNVFNYIRDKHSSKIFQLYRGQSLRNADPKGVSFEEFVRYVVDYPASDIHWRSVAHQAHPCTLKYHYIAKQETLDHDLHQVVDTYLSGKHTSIKLKSWRHIDSDTQTRGKFLPLLSQLPQPEMWIERLLVPLGHDMKMFGYSYKVIDGQVYATCEKYTRDMMCV